MFAVLKRHAENYCKHDVCPWPKGSDEYERATTIPREISDVGLKCIPGCVPIGKGSWWAFPNGHTTTTNLEILFNDLAFLASRLYFATKKRSSSCRRNISNYSMRLICHSQYNLKDYKEHSYNKQQVLSVWKGVITHLGWYITMNRNHFPKPTGAKFKFTPEVLETVRQNCIHIGNFLYSTIMAGHDGKFFVKNIARSVLPDVMTLSPFLSNDCGEAYKAAHGSWKVARARITNGVCADFESKSNNTAFWKMANGKGQSGWVFEAVFMSMYDHTLAISKPAKQLFVMDMTEDVQKNYNELRRWSFFTESFDERWKRLGRDPPVPTTEDLNHLNEEMEGMFDDLKDAYKHNRHPNPANKLELDGQAFPKMEGTDKYRLFLFGKTKRGWSDFVRPSTAKNSSIRWRPDEVAEVARWSEKQMAAHNTQWRAEQDEMAMRGNGDGTEPSSSDSESGSDSDDSDDDDGYLDVGSQLV